MLCVAFAWKGMKIGIEKVFFYRYLCLKIILGENIYKFIIILFTRKDDLDEEKKKDMYEYIENSPPELRRFIHRCGGRCIAFNNRLKDNKLTICWK